MPYLGGFEQRPEYNIYAEGACSSCQGLLAFTMEKLKALGEYEKNAGISILLGRTKDLPQGVESKDLILMGDCVKKYRDQGLFVEGCPPGEPLPLWAITDRRLDLVGNWRERMAAETPIFLDYLTRKKHQR
ncbi:hypothetical protein ACFL0Q_09510 [Thermodesulfobacteriota bacterium]